MAATEETPTTAAETLPPGSRLPALVQTVRLLRDPAGFLHSQRERYGDVFRVNLVGMGPLVWVADPALAKAIFASDRDVGLAGEARRPFLEPLVGETSMLVTDGEEWQRHRLMVRPAFHGDSVTAWREEIAEIAAREVDTWPVTGEPIELRPRVQVITLDVILRIVFGVRDAARLDRLRRLVTDLMELGTHPAVSSLPPLRRRLEAEPLKRLPGNPLRRFVAVREETDVALREEIARARVELAAGTERGDVLAMLISARDDDGRGLEDHEVRDELITLLEAGHETTATALTWAFERLVRHPRVMEKLIAELEQGKDEYLDATVKETLRSRPVVIDAPRRLAGPLELGGHTVPAGWTVAPALPLVHSAPDAFPDAEEFRPERFLEDDPPLGAWFPFGGGRRRCVGSQLALLELRTIIPEVLRRFRPRALDPAPEKQRMAHVTLAPARQGRVAADPAPDYSKSDSSWGPTHATAGLPPTSRATSSTSS